MKKIVLFVVALVILLGIGAVVLDPTRVLQGYIQGERFFQGRPTSYWKRALADHNPTAQEETLKAFKGGGEAAAPVLAELLKENRKSDWAGAEARWRAAELLGEIGPDARAAVPALATALLESDPHVRKVAADALGAIHQEPQVAVPALAEMLKTGECLDAVKALAKFGPEAHAALPALLDLLKDKDGTVRWQAVYALGKIGPEAKEAVPALLTALRTDEDPLVREHSAESLGQIGAEAKTVVPALIQALKDPDQRIRRDAARSLGQFGPNALSAIPALTELLKGEKVARVRDAADKALKILTGYHGAGDKEK